MTTPRTPHQPARRTSLTPRPWPGRIVVACCVAVAVTTTAVAGLVWVDRSAFRQKAASADRDVQLAEAQAANAQASAAKADARADRATAALAEFEAALAAAGGNPAAVVAAQSRLGDLASEVATLNGLVASCTASATDAVAAARGTNEYGTRYNAEAFALWGQQVVDRCADVTNRYHTLTATLLELAGRTITADQPAPLPVPAPLVPTTTTTTTTAPPSTTVPPSTTTTTPTTSAPSGE